MKETFIVGYLASKFVLITSRKPVSYRLVVVDTISLVFEGGLSDEYEYPAIATAHIATTMIIEAWSFVRAERDRVRVMGLATY
jgi:hypothetical protein